MPKLRQIARIIRPSRWFRAKNGACVGAFDSAPGPGSESGPGVNGHSESTVVAGMNSMRRSSCIVAHHHELTDGQRQSALNDDSAIPKLFKK
jgi:hypothetical protein